MISAEYAAGFFDGEGCVTMMTVGKNREMKLRVQIANTEEMILRALQASFGGAVNMRSDKRHPNRKACGQLVFCGGDAERFLRSIQPHVRVKKGQVVLALEFLEFCNTPKSERCELIPSKARIPIAGVPGKFMTPKTWIRKPETLGREVEFKSKMNAMNLKGRHEKAGNA